MRDVDVDESSGDETQGQAPRCSMERDRDKGAADVMETALVSPGL